jgi:HupF/HypC family
MTASEQTRTNGLGPLADDLATAALALARRFARGGTMWCVAPTWPPHARHVAVEFVHPVIVGKRALPAVAVDATDVVGFLRPAVRAGDVILSVAPGEDPAVGDAMQRAPAWGVETVWIGAGPEPALGVADHVLWIDDSDLLTAYRSRFVLLYHLLWELTHVCFEHPGLLEASDRDRVDDVCITCSDEGRLGEVITAADHSASIRTADGDEAVDVSLVGPVAAGDLVVVHAGVAISRLEEGS